MSAIPSMGEHSDLIQVFTIFLLGLLGFMIKKWDKAHAERMAELAQQNLTTAEQLSKLARDFYILRGEHNVHHGRRAEDSKFDELGFENSPHDKRHHL